MNMFSYCHLLICDLSCYIDLFLLSKGYQEVSKSKNYNNILAWWPVNRLIYKSVPPQRLCWSTATSAHQCFHATPLQTPLYPSRQHFLKRVLMVFFASANTNSSATGPRWLSVIRKLTVFPVHFQWGPLRPSSWRRQTPQTSPLFHF